MFICDGSQQRYASGTVASNAAASPDLIASSFPNLLSTTRSLVAIWFAVLGTRQRPHDIKLTGSVDRCCFETN
jgi:hypothetical protein